MSNIDNDALKKAVASSNLGKEEKEALSNGIQSGDISKFLGRLSPEESRRLQGILSDKQATERLLSTPQAQALLKKILKK